jgi:hypothetical protein
MGSFRSNIPPRPSAPPHPSLLNMSVSSLVNTIIYVKATIPYSGQISELWRNILRTTDVYNYYNRDDKIVVIAFGRMRDWSFPLGVFKKRQDKLIVFFNKTKKVIVRVLLSVW